MIQRSEGEAIYGGEQMAVRVRSSISSQQRRIHVQTGLRICQRHEAPELVLLLEKSGGEMRWEERRGYIRGYNGDGR